MIDYKKLCEGQEFYSAEYIISAFEAPKDSLDGCQLIYALYETGSWEGSAEVLYKKDDLFYYVSGSHCSCNGLEGQWEPEEVSREWVITTFDPDKKNLSDTERTRNSLARQAL